MLKLTARVLATVALFVGAGAAPDAHATIVRGFSLDSMSAEAHSIVRGDVVDQEVVYDSRWGRVYTHSLVEVSEVLWGTEQPGDIVVVRQIGGELDGVTSRVVGTARVEIGDEVVVFARTDGELHYLVGMAQGLYQVARDGDGKARVSRGISGLEFMQRVGPLRGVAPSRDTLERLVSRVLQAVGRTP